MLPFWKKDKLRSPHQSPKKVVNGTCANNSVDFEPALSVGPLSTFQHADSSYEPCNEKSRLTLALEDVLSNRVALSYYSQFMEAKGYSSLFNLWMDLTQPPFHFKHLLSKKSSAPTNSPVKGHPGKTESVDGEGTKTKPSITTLFQQYFSEDAPFKIRLPEDLKADIKAAYQKNSQAESDNCLARLEEFLTQTMKKDIWQDFQKSEWYCKYQIEVMTSRSMTLGDVLHNDSCLHFFIEFLEQEGFLNLIEFWLAATSFEKQYNHTENPDFLQMQNDSILIYDKYLSLQATSPLGICDKIRFAVEEGISGESEISPHCLRPAVGAVEAFLRVKCLRLFLSSQQYLLLLSEVMTTSSKSNPSPSSSVTEGSVETNKPLNNQDAIWRRRRHFSGLSFGRIDQLGRFETDFEPEPDKKSESRLSRVVRLLLNKDEHKAQEEMAWRVAEMIVKDVTSVTMGSSQLSDDEV